MKQLILIFACLSIIFAAQAGPSPKAKKANNETKFGGKIADTKTTSLAKVMSDFKNYEGKTVVFEATPEKVCETKGCWMVVKDGDKQVRTMFKDYGFFVPKSILGKKVKVQGKMKKKHVSAATIRHFMKDEGKKLTDIQKVRTGRIQFEFEADAVEIL